MSDTQETTEATENTTNQEWQTFFDQVNNAWNELGTYFNWPNPHTDEGEDEDKDEETGDEVEATVAETDEPAASESGVNSKDSPLNPAIKHANAFFEMYLARRPSELAYQALGTAFSMYFNCPDTIQRADAAVEQIGDDLDGLATIAPMYVSMYRADNDEAAGDALAERLLERLGNDERRAGLLIDMADNWMWNGQYDKARPVCERILAMDADERTHQRAKGMLYEMDNLNVGQMAPAFEATDIDGNPISLAGLRGKAVLIDFWATWCGPCRGEFPHLRRVNEKFAGERFMLLSISLDENCDEARKMIVKEKLAWTHVCEGQWHGSRIAELYNVMGIPSTWLIAPDGKIAAKELRGHGADKAVAALLGLEATPAA